MPKKIKCSRCRQEVGKNFIYRDSIQMIFHPKCARNYDWEQKNKEMLNKRKRNIQNPLQGGTGSKK